jgi:hypothetical protein
MFGTLYESGHKSCQILQNLRYQTTGGSCACLPLSSHNAITSLACRSVVSLSKIFAAFRASVNCSIAALHNTRFTRASMTLCSAAFSVLAASAFNDVGAGGGAAGTIATGTGAGFCDSNIDAQPLKQTAAKKSPKRRRLPSRLFVACVPNC